MITADNLQHYSLFGGLLAEQIETIIPLMQYAQYAPGAVILEEGRRNDSIHFILEGRVLVSKAGHQLAELPEGQTFGEMELLDVMPAAATIKAMEAVRLALISNTSLHTLYCLDTCIFAIIMMNLARDLSRRLRRMDEFVISKCP